MKRDPHDYLPVVPGFDLKSTIIADGQVMPVAHRSGIFAAGAEDTSPDVEWSGFPANTRSFMISMYDPGAPTPSGFWHWASGTGLLALGRDRRAR